MGKKSRRTRANAGPSQSRADLTGSIMDKWKEQGTFVRFLDGDRGNCAADNLEHIQMPDAMEHFDDWTFDWDINLTLEEQALVLDSQWRTGLRFNKIEEKPAFEIVRLVPDALGGAPHPCNYAAMPKSYAKAMEMMSPEEHAGFTAGFFGQDNYDRAAAGCAEFHAKRAEQGLPPV